jgi:hypothetical protein
MELIFSCFVICAKQLTEKSAQFAKSRQRVEKKTTHRTSKKWVAV